MSKPAVYGGRPAPAIAPARPRRTIRARQVRAERAAKPWRQRRWQ